jgi:hypothetical protein
MQGLQWLHGQSRCWSAVSLSGSWPYWLCGPCEFLYRGEATNPGGLFGSEGLAGGGRLFGH